MGLIFSILSFRQSLPSTKATTPSNSRKLKYVYKIASHWKSCEMKWQHPFNIVWDFTRFFFFFQSLPPTKTTTPSNSRWRWSSGSNSSRWYKIAIPNRICSLQWRWRGVYFIRSYWCHKCYYRYSGFYWHRSFDCSKAQIHTGNKFDNMVF